jgi:ribonuclease G
MGATLVINATGVETRVALVENGTISEFYLERKKDKGIVGNIYKGRVVRVLPGMQAAFVDIGLEKAAFLYVSDVFYDPDFSEQQFDLTEGEHEDVADLEEPDVGPEEGEAEESSAEAEASALEEPDVPELEGAAQGQDAREELLDAAPQPTAGAVPLASEEKEPSSAAPQVESVEPAESPAQAAVVLLSTEREQAAAAVPTPLVNELEPGSEEKALGREEAPAGAQLATPPPAPADAGASPQGPAGTAGVPPAVQGRKGEGGERGELRVRERGRRRRRGGVARKEGRADREERRPEREGPGGERVERNGKPAPKKTANIQDLLKVGQEVIVQVAKDPIGTKGARVTSHISLPGRHLVFMPTVDHVGISRRIEKESERRRLREIVDRLRPPGTGFIVRTVAENISNEKLEADARFLIGIWNMVGSKKEKQGAPAVLHPDLDLALRATRDLFAQDVEKLVIDDRLEWDRVSRFVESQDPSLKERVVLHDSEEPIFDAYGIEHELQKAQQRKVWLKSGGYLIMDQAEALTAIDVNSGRYVGKKSLEETITKINTEAAREIVYQLRLRNIGGIIIIDFIDMDKTQNRDKVFKALQDALGRDKAKTNVLKISELGLVEMTRKRVRESLGRTLNEPCGYCDGRGHVKSKRTVAYEVFREIRREASNYKENVLVVNCHPEVARVLQVDERDELRYLMDRFNKSIHVRTQQSYHQEQFDIYGKSERTQKKGGEREEREAEGRERGEPRGERPRPAAAEVAKPADAKP